MQNAQTKALICGIHSSTRLPINILKNRRHMRIPVNSSLPRLQSIIASLALALSVALTASAQSQITTGTIEGRVEDPNGAVVPGASVEIKNTATNNSRSLTTNDEGRFTALQLTPGKYSVTVSKEGFATADDPNVTVTVGGTSTLVFPMQVSRAAERVTVTATTTVDTAKT